MPGAHKGEKIGDAYIRITSDGEAIGDGVRKGLKDADPTVREAGGRHAKRWSDGFDEGMRGKFAKMFRRETNDPKISKDARKLGNDVSKWFNDGIGDNKGFSDSLVRDFNRISFFGRRLGRDLDPLEVKVTRTGRGLRNVGREGHFAAKGMGDARQSVHRFRDAMERLDVNLDRYADKTGRVFGRGARNNFINLFGAGVRGMVLLGNIVPKTVGMFFRFTAVLGNMRTAFRAANGGMSGFAAAAGVGGKALVGLAANAVALVAGFAALVFVVGPLVSLLSGLAAAATALAASLTFAAAAAGGALLGTLMPLAAGAAVVAAAFIGMNKAQKKALAADFKPLKNEFSRLGATARQTLLKDIGEASRTIAPHIRALNPVVHGVALAIGDIGRSFGNALDSPGYKGFVGALTDFLPNATRLLGQVTINAFGGLGGLLHSVMPLTSQFLHWLERITGEFAAWSNTHRGQVALRGFFAKAAESAKSVGRFVREAVVATAKLFDLGRGAGNTLFDDMANSLARFSRYLDANPGAVGRWFANGVQIARDVGNAFRQVIHVFQALDSAQNRAFASAALQHAGTAFRLIKVGIDIATFSAQLFVRTLGAMAIAIGAVLKGIGAITPGDTFEKIGRSVSKTGEAMFHFKTSTVGAKDAMGGMAGQGGSLASSLDQVTGATTRSTRAWALNKLQQEGAVKISNSFGVSTRDLIDASLGNAGALARVNEQLSHGGPLTAGVVATLRKMGIQVEDTGRKIRTQESNLQTWGEALRGIKGKDVRIAIRETGMNPTIAKFRNLIKTQHLTPKQVKIAARALNVPLTSAQLRRLQREARDLGKQKPTPKVGIEPGKFNRGHRDALAKLAKLRATKTVPRLDVNGRPLTAGANAALSKMRAVARSGSRPSVRINVSGTNALEHAKNVMDSFHDRQVTMTTRYTSVGKVGKPTARGAMVNYAQTRLIGEAGPEAVVPLNRPLSQVDPSVRWLSAIAQGKPMAAGGVVGGGRTVNIGGFTLVTPTEDPAAVAQEAVNRLAGMVMG